LTKKWLTVTQLENDFVGHLQSCSRKALMKRQRI
jgi:hypothetical protein